MGFWCGCDAEGDVLEGRDAPRAWQPASVGLPMQCLEQLATQCGGPSTTARQLIETVILPRTKGHGSCYAQLLGGQSLLGRPTHYVAISWDVPLEPALQAVMQHLKHNTQPCGGTTGAAGISQALPTADSNSSDVVYVFIDFLCIDLWGEASTASSSVQPTKDSAVRSRPRLRKASTRALLLNPPMFGGAHQLGRMSSCPDLTKHESILHHADMDLYIADVTTVLSSSRRTSINFMLYLDPELSVLSSLGPMHAAWRAMHAGLPMHFVCSSELAWLHHRANHANTLFALHQADEPDTILRSALLADLHESVMATIGSGSGSGSDAGARLQLTDEQRQQMVKQISTEEQSLWRCLLRAAMLEEQHDASGQDRDHVARQIFLKAVFLALDGQYRVSMAKLQEAHETVAAKHGGLSMQSVPVLCLMVRVALQQGNLLEARRLTVEAQEACKASRAQLGLPSLHVQACNALVLEGFQQASAAEDAWRNTYIQLDQLLGPRHPLTLDFMGQLGRLVSKMKGRHEEGALLLTECLKSTLRLTAGQPAVCGTTSCLGLVQLSPPPAPEMQRTLAARYLRLLVSCLSIDLAVALRQLVISAEQAGEQSPGFGCNCTDQIKAAFISMDLEGELEGGSACALQPSHDSESKRLWKQAVKLLEISCGPQHEASCLWRAKAAAEKAVPGVLQNAEDVVFTTIPRSSDLGANASVGSPMGRVLDAQATQLGALEAVQVLKAEVSSLQKLLGPNPHVCTLEAQALLASTLDVHGSAAEVETAWRLVSDGRRQLLGGESVHTARALARLAACLAKQGKHAEGAVQSAAAAAAVAVATGNLSTQSGVAFVKEAEIHRVAGDLRSAELALDRAVKAHQHCYGMTNWRTKQVYAALAEVYELQGRAQDAVTLRTTYKVRV